MKTSVVQGRVWVLLDEEGRLIEDIDTDQIYHNAHLHVTDISKMGQYALGNLEGWRDFSAKARPGDFIVAGRNFGAGSSRQQAVDCFISLGISLILAPTFGAIYYRNAVNSGFPVLRSPELEGLTEAKRLETGDKIRVDFKEGSGKNITKNYTFVLEPMNQVQHEIYLAGGLFSYGKKLK
ncbi:MAG: 3-isopropylmalate dehydratase [Candidatus Aminicenantales bacterium]